MLYPPGVVIFRTDANDDYDDTTKDAIGDVFIAPYAINVVLAVSVNVAADRARHGILPEERNFLKQGISGALKEHIARVLCLFEEWGVRTFVFDAFGTGLRMRYFHCLYSNSRHESV